MSVDVGLLRRQRTTVLNGMQNSREQISILSDKITRLRTASNNLESSITELETSKSNIDNLSINNSRWKGTNENNFNGRYSTYQGHVGNFVQHTKNAKSTIDEEISQAEQSKAAYTTGLNNLQSTLNSLDAQIRNAESG